MKHDPIIRTGLLRPTTWPRAALAERFRSWRRQGIKVERRAAHVYCVHPYVILTRGTP